MLKGISLLYKLFNFASQPVKLISVIIMSCHFPLLFSNIFLDSLTLLFWTEEHVVWKLDILELLQFQEIPQFFSMAVHSIECKELFDLVRGIIVDIRIDISPILPCFPADFILLLDSLLFHALIFLLFACNQPIHGVGLLLSSE